jgi:HK97 family phage major capsid protein
MTLIEIKDQRNKLMADAQKLMLTPNTENRSAFDTMMKTVDELELDLARLERVAKHEAETRAQGKPARGNPGAGPSADPIENAELQKRSFRDYIVSGKTETRDLGVSLTNGPQLVAPAFYPILTQAMQSYGGIVNIVNQKTTETGASMKLSFSSDVANGLSTWGESTAVPEVDPALATAQSATEAYTTGSILVTLEELEDSFFNIDQFISDIFGQRLYRGLAKYVSQGSTSGVFSSYLSGATSGATSAAGTSIVWQDVVNLWNSVDPIYAANGTFVMNSTTRGSLLSQVDGMGRPFYTPSPSAGAFDTLLGRPVVLDQFLPNVALSSKSLAFGDFKAGYTLRNVASGFQIARDPYTYLASKGSVQFVGYGRGGSFSTDAGTHPIKYLSQKAS